MKIDISSILKETGGKISFEGNVTLPQTDFLGEYRFTEPFSVKGTVSNNGKSYIMLANARGNMITDCARCMKEITVPISFDIDENLVRGEDESTQENDDVIVFHDAEIELDSIVRDNFIMKIPGKYLCSEDCKGLCPNCGKDLNEGDCGCPSENIDPRWAALLDIMDKKK